MAGFMSVVSLTPPLAQWRLAKRHFLWRTLLAVFMLGLSFPSAYGMYSAESQAFDLPAHDVDVQDFEFSELAVVEGEKGKLPFPWPLDILSSHSGDLDEEITYQLKNIQQNALLTDAEKLLSYINVLETQDIGYQVLYFSNDAHTDEVIAGVAAAACRIGAACLLLIAEILDHMS